MNHNFIFEVICTNVSYKAVVRALFKIILFFQWAFILLWVLLYSLIIYFWGSVISQFITSCCCSIWWWSTTLDILQFWNIRRLIILLCRILSNATGSQLMWSFYYRRSLFRIWLFYFYFLRNEITLNSLSKSNLILIEDLSLSNWLSSSWLILSQWEVALSNVWLLTSSLSYHWCRLLLYTKHSMNYFII